MGKKKKPFEQDEVLPFDHLPLREAPDIRITLDPLRYPIWTENKAKLIRHYLFLFVQITKHGTYIDGFAGPQQLQQPDMWAAKLVLEIKLLQHFYLFDKSRKKYKALKTLQAEEPDLPKKGKKPSRTVEIRKGDFNILVTELLSSGKLRDTEATFCLLDQHTFECSWDTVKALAAHKSGRKIELFYFLAIAWLDRAFAGQKKLDVLAKWWGRDDWATLKDLNAKERADAFVTRFKDDLGYKSVMAWPIFKRKNTGNIMYYMIHATDHEAAPGLMYRAYHESIKPLKKQGEQMEFADFLKEYNAQNQPPTDEGA